MADVTLNLNDSAKGAFYIKEGEVQLGEMAISITGSKMIVYHTEVAPEAEGKGLAKEMLEAMVDYARNNQLKVIPLCPYVHAQFEKHPVEYTDVWK